MLQWLLMSKIFQIAWGKCQWDCTADYVDVEDARAHFAPNIHFEEAPDYVFTGWTFDETQEGDARFVKPLVPEGMVYNEETGEILPEGWEPPKEVTMADLDKENKMLKAQLTACADRQEFLEDCIAEMAMEVYSL